MVPLRTISVNMAVSMKNLFQSEEPRPNEEELLTWYTLLPF